MTTFLLIRHAAHELGGQTIAGRSPGVHLSPQGRDEALQLCERLAGLPIRAIYSSPLERALETAEPVAARLGLPIELSEELIEVDFGDWTRELIDSLKPLESWKQWNQFRSGTRIPNGELMLETQLRIVREMERLRHLHPNVCIALFGHGDVIKAAVAYWLGVPLDLFQRIEIGLASVSVVAIGEYGPWVLCVNSTHEIPLPP